MFSSAVLTSAPASEPVTLTEVKAQLRIDTVDHDAFLTSLIVASRQFVETYLRRALITQTWKFNYDDFPQGIELPINPVQSVSSITYKDTAGATQTLAGTEYVLDAEAEPALIHEAYDKDWPDTYDMPKSVSVTCVCGYGAAAAVPAPIKQGLLIIISSWHEDRQATGEMPKAAEYCLAPYRMVRC